MKSIRKIITALMIFTVIISAASGCQRKPIEEDFLVYNNTDMILTAVYISTEEEPFLDENAFKIADLENPLIMRSNINTVIVVPSDMHDEEFNIYVDGYGSVGMLKTQVDAGKLFADGIWGIEIGQAENGSLTVKLLGDGDV